MLQNKYLCIYKVTFEVKYLPRDDCGLSMSPHLSIIDLNICKMAKIALKKLCTHRNSFTFVVMLTLGAVKR